MGKHTAAADFATVITVAGTNKAIVLSKGDTVELDDDELAAVERDVPGAFAAPAAKSKKAAPKGGSTKGDA